MKTIVLFGGSFNPAHPGHFETAAYINSLFRPDEVWMMFSINRMKDPSQYAPLHHRMAMGDLLARHFPDVPFIMSDIEDKIGNNETFVVLSELKTLYPDHHFIWVMGADNLIHFHQWIKADDIIQSFPLIVIDRPPYTDQALQSPIAQKFAHLQRGNLEEFRAQASGWIFVPNPGGKVISSSELLKKLRDPATDLDRDFSGPFRDVVDYIRQHKLYGIGSTPSHCASMKPKPPGF